MSRVQIILILLVAGSALLYFTVFRSKLWDRLLVFLLALSGTYLILRPDRATSIANALGVGRGVDLIFYLAILGLGFVVLLLFSQIRELESKLIKLTRATATIQTPPPPSEERVADKGEIREPAHERT